MPILVTTDILEFQTFKIEDDCNYKFTPFNDEIREAVEKGSSLKPKEQNMVVVATREDGFDLLNVNKKIFYYHFICSFRIF